MSDVVNKDEVQESYERRIAMVNTLLGEGFKGTFEFTFDTKQEAEDNAKMFSQWYDIQYTHDEDEECFVFDTNDYKKRTIFSGIAYKAIYLEK